MKKFEKNLIVNTILCICIQITITFAIKIVSNGLFSLTLLFASLIFGFILVLIFKGSLNAILFCLIISIIGFKVSPSLINSGLIIYKDSIFSEYDYPTSYSFMYLGSLIACLAFKINKSSLVKSCLIAGPMLILRYMLYDENLKISNYQEVSDLIIVIFVLSVYFQFAKIKYINTKKIYLCFRVLFYFCIAEIFLSLIPAPWTMSYRNGISGFFLNSEQQLSYLIIIGIIFIYQYDINKYIKLFLLLILYLGMYFTYNKSGLLLSFLIPILYIIYNRFHPTKLIILSIFIATFFLYLYSGLTGKEELMTIAARLLSLTNPLDSFLNNSILGIGPAISSSHQLSNLTIYAFDSDIFKYFLYLNNNININSTMLQIQEIKDYANIPPSGPHIYGFQLIYSMGILGSYIAYITYYSLPNTISQGVKNKYFNLANVLCIILVSYSFFHPQNITFILVLATALIKNNDSC